MGRNTLDNLRWVDPPSGWKYGFPRVYDPEEWDSMEEFLVHHGYPEHDIDFGMQYSRSWPVEKE